MPATITLASQITFPSAVDKIVNVGGDDAISIDRLIKCFCLLTSQDG